MVIGFFAPGFNVSAWHLAFADTSPQVDFRPWPNWGPPDELDYVLVWQPTPDLFEDCRNLKAIISLGAGVDHVFKAKLPAGVPIVRMADRGLVDFMTSFVVMSVLFHHRDMVHYARQQKDKQWLPRDPVLPQDRNTGFMGLGNMAIESAQVLQRMGHPISSWSRSSKNVDGIVSHHGMEQLGDFLAHTDILVCILPATAATTGLLDSNTLSQLPRGASIINVGRGNVLVMDDLVELLDKGHLSGATLDVFDKEPLTDSSALWEHPKIVITPHVASPSLPNSVAEYVMTVIRDSALGKPLPNVVNMDAGY